MEIHVSNGHKRSAVTELSEDHAWALAELCKRITFSDCRSNAVDQDEAYRMIDAMAKLSEILAKIGYSPR